MRRAFIHWLFFLCIIAATLAMVVGFSRQAALAPAPASASTATLSTGEGPLAMTATLTQSKLPRGAEGRTTLSLTLKGALEGETSRHVPPNRHVDIAVVLDRSGSMRGDKLAGAKEALRTLVAAMTEQDRFALVSYADDVTTDRKLSRCTPNTKAALQRDIESLEAGGNTNLGAGLDAGLQALTQEDDSPNIRLVLLVSDGLANRGVTDPSRLGRTAALALVQHIMVSTVGVGLDFNELLMTRLADQGGGSYRFLEDPRSFAAGFFEEFNTARKVVALNLELRIVLPRGVQLLEASGYPVEMEGLTAVIRPGSLAAGASRTLHLNLQVQADRASAYEIGPVTVRYGQAEGLQTLTLDQPLVIACVEDRREAEASIDKGAWERKVLHEDFNKLKEEVAAKVREGDASGAQQAIDEYTQAQQAANAVVGSDRVQENLDHEVAGLRDQLEATQAAPPAARAEIQMRMSKSMQYEGYSARRDK